MGWRRRTTKASSIATSSRRTSSSPERAGVKILDFGLAKLKQAPHFEAGKDEADPTQT